MIARRTLVMFVHSDSVSGDVASSSTWRRPLRDRSLSWVVTGRKRATAGLLSEWESAKDPLEVGRCWAVVDSAEQRVAVVETTELRIGTFDDVD